MNITIINVIVGKKQSLVKHIAAVWNSPIKLARALDRIHDLEHELEEADGRIADLEREFEELDIPDVDELTDRVDNLTDNHGDLERSLEKTNRLLTGTFRKVVHLEAGANLAFDELRKKALEAAEKISTITIEGDKLIDRVVELERR